jgi:excisionase family DNA binding protein
MSFIDATSRSLQVESYLDVALREWAVEEANKASKIERLEAELLEAAAFLRIHTDTLAGLARAGEIPGCKVGRAWVFMPELLKEYVRCRSTVSPKARIGGSAYKSLAQRLGARLAQTTAKPPRNTSSANVGACGASTNLGTVVQLRSPKPLPVG